MRILLALGGNALLRRGERASAPNQLRNVEAAAKAVAELADHHELIVTHDSGPQVGHALELSLRNELVDRDVVSVLTQVVVTADDPSFGRLNPVPEPRAIAEIRSLRALVAAGALVLCANASQPVALDELGTLREVEASTDLDLTAALLARRLDADLLLLLTDVDALQANWGGPGQQPTSSVCPAELRGMSFAADSVGPKVEAACRFAEATGRRAAIGAIDNLSRVIGAEAGTQVLAPASQAA